MRAFEELRRFVISHPTNAASPYVRYGEKPKIPGVPLADVPETGGYGREALELVLPQDAVLPNEITEPGFVPRRFHVPAGVLN